MKRILIDLLCLTLLFSCTAFAEGSDPLANVALTNGRLTGTVTACFGFENDTPTFHELLVDCPLPEAAYPQEILTVGNRYFSKADMQRALKTIGQDANGHFLNNRTEARYTGDWNAEAAADISKEEAAQQAIIIGLAYFDALGIEVSQTPRIVSRPYDLEAALDRQRAYWTPRFSDYSAMEERFTATWKHAHRFDPEQTAYTEVVFDVLLEGKLCWNQPSYPAGYADEPDAWAGHSVSASVIVSGSGILVQASACNIPEIKSRRSLAGDPVYTAFLAGAASRCITVAPGSDWQSALRAALADSSRVGTLYGNSQDSLFQTEYMGEPVVAYGYTTVITGLFPVLHTITQYEWAPFFAFECEYQSADGSRFR